MSIILLTVQNLIKKIVPNCDKLMMIYFKFYTLTNSYFSKFATTFSLSIRLQQPILNAFIYEFYFSHFKTFLYQ